MICYYVSAVTWNSIFALGGGVNVKKSGVELHEVLVQIVCRIFAKTTHRALCMLLFLMILLQCILGYPNSSVQHF